ncbi:hypothetical protein BD408DRAFT_421506 [Parasitella parasitica]|nr:hypothetical protein BD408DRAFT_421506 [Parasitella parasitica]
MPRHGKRGNGRGRRGGACARGGRGRGRGIIGGGGRGCNRELIPSAIGYVYRTRSNADEFSDDFRIYGEFSSDEADSEIEARQFVPHKRVSGKHRQKKSNFGFVKEARQSYGSNYDEKYEDAMDRAGLGSSSQQNVAAMSNQQFATGKSKYLKTVLFTKSSSSIDLTKETEDTSIEQNTVLETSMSNLSLQDEKLLAKEELWGILKGNNPIHDDVSVEANHFSADLKAAAIVTDMSKIVKAKQPLENSLQIVSSSGEEDVDIPTEMSGGSDIADTRISYEEIGLAISDQNVDEDIASDDDYFEDIDDTEDELQEEDMLIMSDYMERIILEDEEDEEDLDGLLAWSAMQEGNLEIELDQDEDEDEDGSHPHDFYIPNRASARENPLLEEGKLKLTKKMGVPVNEDMSKKVGHRNRDDNSIVDPEIFGQTLKAALADVPPGLRPGMRRWFEKQQRKEKKKKRDEAKAHRKEKKNGKREAKDMEDQDLTNQMAKIDERIRDFIQDDSISSFQFAPMATHVRRQLHVLAAAYNLKSKSAGGGGSRCTIVTKTPTTYIPDDRRYISRYLLDIQTNMGEQNRIIGKNNAKGNQKGRKKIINGTKKNSDTSTSKHKRGDTQFPAGPSHGTIVAFDAAPISESNVGHRMLAAMGWKQGEALGSKSDGIIAPIEAIIRKKGRGLGS